MIERDKIKTKKMEELGYKVFRFKGSEIKNNINECLNKIYEG